MCGRKARDALLQAPLVPASSIMDKIDLCMPKLDPTNGACGTSAKTCLRKSGEF